MTAPVYTRQQIVKAVAAVIYAFFLLGMGVWIYEQQRYDDCQRKRYDIIELRQQLWAHGSIQQGQDPQAYWLEIITAHPTPTC